MYCDHFIKHFRHSSCCCTWRQWHTGSCTLQNHMWNKTLASLVLFRLKEGALCHHVPQRSWCAVSGSRPESCAPEEGRLQRSGWYGIGSVSQVHEDGKALVQAHSCSASIPRCVKSKVYLASPHTSSQQCLRKAQDIPEMSVSVQLPSAVS